METTKKGKGGRRPGAGRPRKDGLPVGTGRTCRRDPESLDWLRRLAETDRIDRAMAIAGWRLDQEHYCVVDEPVIEELARTSPAAAREFKQWVDESKRTIPPPRVEVMVKVAAIRAREFAKNRRAWKHSKDSRQVCGDQAYRDMITDYAVVEGVVFPGRPPNAPLGFTPGAKIPPDDPPDEPAPAAAPAAVPVFLLE